MAIVNFETFVHDTPGEAIGAALKFVENANIVRRFRTMVVYPDLYNGAFVAVVVYDVSNDWAIVPDQIGITKNRGVVGASIGAIGA